MTDTAKRLAEIAEYARHPHLTEGPWWSDESNLCWRLHGVMARLSPPPGLDDWPEQIMNKQILKAPKSGTTQMEYWPDPADGEFIVKARMDLPRLLAAVERVHEWATSDVVTARNEFGAGYREAMRDIRDLLAGALAQDTEERR